MGPKTVCDDQVEDDTEVKAAEAELDEVDRATHQSPRKYTIRRRHQSGSGGSRMNKMLNKYKTKLDFRCNGTLCHFLVFSLVFSCGLV